MLKRVLIGILCAVLLVSPALAEETASETADPNATDGAVVEDYVEDDGMSEVVGQADQALPSIDGLTPLYTT